MPAPRQPLALLLAALISFGTVPVTAAHATPDLAPAAAADPTPSAVESTSSTIGDAALMEGARVSLSGEIVVTISDPTEIAGHHEETAAAAPASRTLSVLTEQGDLVAVTTPASPAANDLVSGDSFDGSVAIAEGLLGGVSRRAAMKLEGAAAADPLSASDPAARELFAAAAASSTTLEVAEATIESAAAVATAPTRGHELHIVMARLATTAPTYTAAQFDTVAKAATSYWTSTSAGAISGFTMTTTTQSVDKPSQYGCTANEESRWREAAALLGIPLQNFFDGSGRHLVVVLPQACASETLGIGTVGDSLHGGGLLTLSVGRGVDRQTLIHEIGHNIGLGHSNLDLCAEDAPTAGCIEYEYGDLTDVMGAGVSGFDGPLVLNAPSRVALGFEAVPSTQRLALTAGQNTRTFTATIYPAESTLTPALLEVVDPVAPNSTPFYLETRSGEYSSQPSGPYYSQGFSRAFGNRTVVTTPGVRLLRRTTTRGSAVLTSPTSASPVTDRPAIVAGGTVQNPSGSVKVQVTSYSATRAIVAVTLTKAVPPATQPVYRFWSPTNQTHFFTIDPAERDFIMRNYSSQIWTFEGVAYDAFSTQVTGSVPLYRFYSPKNRGHFFTTNVQERDQVISSYPRDIWTYEGVAYFVYPADTTVESTVTVARFWSPKNQHHFYTANAGERDSVRSSYPANIWTFEGSPFRVPVTY